ncbi:MAG: polymerase sigma factor, sigma-70 family [Candidatus Doudnabacteria bacterium]|nr:polymerase sigma factor, sigma-70 family [Candidatus Doudnabacteria bacterium]
MKRTLGDSAAVSTVLAEPTDKELIKTFLGGDERAYAHLMTRYRGRLINFIYRIIRDEAKAEDLVQEVYIRVYRNIHRFDLEKKFSTWVYAIASNLAKNELRNQKHNPVVSQLALGDAGIYGARSLRLADSGHQPDEMFNKRQLARLVRVSVEKLPEHHRTIFTMRELEGRSYEEIADSAQIKYGTVKSRLNRARVAFAKLIGRSIEAEEFVPPKIHNPKLIWANERQQMKASLRELLIVEPEITPDAAYSRLTPPISARRFKAYFKRIKARL